MRARKIWIIAAIFAATVAIAAKIPAQTAVPDSQPKASRQGLSPGPNSSADGNSDAALEIPAPNGPATTETSPASAPSDSSEFFNSQQEELPPVPTSGPPPSMVSGAPSPPLPYLGISVQRIESHSAPGRDVYGLEIVSVDPGSPAQRAGLKGRRGMTSLGASGATAGALIAPLDIALMPLLKKTGQLGQTGDLIVAIDDRRVASEVDLETALARTQPGDTVYLTVVRLANDGTHQTVKIPVKLANPASAP
jgi:PDZ domain